MKDKRIDSYIAEEAQWKQDVLTQLRELIHEADPEIKEAFKWGAPTFEHNGQVAWIFCATDWVHFSFPQGILLDVPRGTWEEDETTLSKAKRTLKFREGQEIPVTLLTKLIREHVANNIAGKKFDFNVPKAGSREFNLPHEYERILQEAGLLGDYLARPYYQQKGWISWIESAKTDAIKLKRIEMMKTELRHDQYMPSKNERFEN